MRPESSDQAPALSIITSTRNAASTLARCLHSVAAQDFENWEHWIIDAVSTDETLPIARRAAAQDTRIKLLSEADGGIYDAMNKGIRLARGEWIYFLGADDELFDAGVLSRMFDAKNQDCDFMYGDVMLIPGQRIHGGPFDLVRLLIKNISHQAIFYRRSVFDRLGEFDLRFPVFADWAFNIKCMLDPAVRKFHVDIIVARFHLGGTCRNGEALDPGWHDERMDLLGRQFSLEPLARAMVRSIVEELNRQAEMAETASNWHTRYNNLQRVHNDLLHSNSYRFFRALDRPLRSALMAMRRAGTYLSRK